MNPEENALDRLLTAARRASNERAEPVPVPFSIEARILALRKGSSNFYGSPADDLRGLLRLFQRGLAVAGLVALVTIWFCLAGDENALPAMDVTVLDSAEEISFLP